MSVLVGKNAPNFNASAVLADGQIVNNYRLSDAINEKYGILFFYPLDFTFVCPSELIALDNRVETFKNLNVELVGISVDSQFSHFAWRNTPVANGGIGPVGYTLVSDLKHEIANMYGVELAEAGVALRATFLIDKQGVVRSQLVNDLPLGRNIDELVRLVEALQFHEEHGEVCPANWNKGKKGMVADSKGVASYLQENAETL